MDSTQPSVTRRFIVMIIGIIILSLGLALFKISLMGNDPSTAFAMAIGGHVPFDIAILLPIVNGIYFIVEILWGRRFIGAGTFVNWLCVGTIMSFFIKIIEGIVRIPEAFLPRLGIMFCGVIVTSFACALYQTARVR